MNKVLASLAAAASLFASSAYAGELVIIFDDLKRFARDRDFHWKLRKALSARGAVPKCLNFNLCVLLQKVEHGFNLNITNGKKWMKQ